MREQLDRLHGHVARQYERRGLDVGRADRIRDLVDQEPAAEEVAAETPPPAPATEEAAGDG